MRSSGKSAQIWTAADYKAAIQAIKCSSYCAEDAEHSFMVPTLLPK